MEQDPQVAAQEGAREEVPQALSQKLLDQKHHMLRWQLRPRQPWQQQRWASLGECLVPSLA